MKASTPSGLLRLQPIMLPPEFKRIRDLYAGKCTHVDRWCGHLIDTLDSLGLKGDTLIVFTSDHGMILGKRGELHKGQDRLRIQDSRCPPLLRHPDHALAGKGVEGFVQHHDLMPTLLRLLDEPVPDRCNGGDFGPLIAGERPGGLSAWRPSTFPATSSPEMSCSTG
ncbi:MAG: sulfatase-like hydrolase/transferase [Armatimonadetes bacterium]|nr:sulfatase-like hydrolase/transferase [Armatimonadota bacterium]